MSKNSSINISGEAQENLKTLNPIDALEVSVYFIFQFQVILTDVETFNSGN